jgi:2-dehydropantoate 2-reductase
MRFLIVGAGALGGYFGGRLLDAGQDVTFLVRQRRLAELDRDGLVIRSRFGDLSIPNPGRVLRADLAGPFDVIVVACKAYDLADTMESFAPAVGPETMILPLLNGMRHLDLLEARFGGQHVLGGVCLISAALDAQHRIVHFNDVHSWVFGERAGEVSERVKALARACSGAGFDARASADIIQEMWEKWVFIAAAAGMTCLMRATIGDIVAAEGAAFATALFDECVAIAAQAGWAPRDAARQRSAEVLTTAGSPITASMLKDIERGAQTEADHILGDLIERGQDVLPAQSLLRLAYVHLRAYAARRGRESATSA